MEFQGQKLTNFCTKVKFWGKNLETINNNNNNNNNNNINSESDSVQKRISNRFNSVILKFLEISKYFQHPERVTTLLKKIKQYGFEMLQIKKQLKIFL